MKPFTSVLVLITSMVLLFGLFGMNNQAIPGNENSNVLLRVGAALPDSQVIGQKGHAVNLVDLKGRIKLISVVPQLNTPVCDEQTHRFSENSQGLDQQVEVITLSTNTAEDQAHFIKKSEIHNMTFLSDSPAYEFGKTTGLFLSQLSVLHRAVIVADRQNIIRYLELVPMGQLPNFDAAQAAATGLVNKGTKS